MGLDGWIDGRSVQIPERAIAPAGIFDKKVKPKEVASMGGRLAQAADPAAGEWDHGCFLRPFGSAEQVPVQGRACGFRTTPVGWAPREGQGGSHSTRGAHPGSLASRQQNHAHIPSYDPIPLGTVETRRVGRAVLQSQC
ncbi:hypothetical protein BX600DRAFT_300105 [Xylariales sp. PMI_506]|nr:hypothetical protein BX600DRAFT_300105 [Xylariales sp. PMI_506]